MKVCDGLWSQEFRRVRFGYLGALVHSIVVGAGSAEITGAVVSTTWISWLAVVLLRSEERRVGIGGRSWFWGQLPGVVASVKVSVGLGSQATRAVGVAQLGAC